MSRRSTAAQLKASGLAQFNRQFYEDEIKFNVTAGVPLEGIPLPPRGTSAKGKEFWNTTIPALCKMGTLSYTDVAQMENLLTAYEVLLKSQAELKAWDSQKHELTIEDAKARKIFLQNYTLAQDSFNALSRAFGLTPVDRTRLPQLQEDSKLSNKKDDPLEALGL